ncbi:hypothetical protein GYMLUDRAFT_424118 [Collybiopsis luxurians FD-317 M1]|uniref:U3 small nucleolar RNA-associated protein 22 n=1 Tax=Collybiopsis luxurians FD-317 M1 TaxID=944289 RepID=A0A0D0D3S8_9AGAR|nr:hypothetical protein GYMLUDRAFT_424118 [Collybiopsis luxurians FD-317 M1]
MTAELKRKRGEPSGSRKLRKLSPDPAQSFASDEEEPENDVEPDVDEEEWGGIQQDNTSSKKSQQPTGEEIRAIRDASDLYRSNTFKLQIDALLPNVQPKSKRKLPLERFLLSLHTFLSSLPDVAPKHPLRAARDLLKNGISVPYPAPLPTEETNWKVAFAKPSDITLVGSWANNTSVKGPGGSKYGVDLAVEMPSNLFQEKDYLNGRFFHKKAFYLATIAAAIANSESTLNVDVSYISTNDDPRLTKLVLEPRSDGSAVDFTKLNARIYIIPTLSPQSPISLHRLSPAHSNIRVTSEISTDSDGDNLSKSPSPQYNTALLTSLVPRPQLLSTHAIQQSVPAFSDALTLLRVWANQRGYGECGGPGLSVRGFDGKGFWWSALLMYLILGEEPTSAGKRAGRAKSKPLGKGLSSYQLFRAALDFLAKHDFENDPIFVKANEGHRYTPDEYHSNHDAVFVDSSSTINVLTGVPTGSLKLLSSDAQKTLEILNDSSSSADPFPDVFLKDHRDLQTRFDAVIRVDLSTVKPRKPNVHLILDSGSASNAILSSLSSLLSQSLGNRIKTLVILHSTPTLRPLSQAHPSTSHVVHIGLIYNAAHAFRQVDHGPSAAETDPAIIETFREFWGDKAELRRFKDGSIIESVVWDVRTVDEKAHIPSKIVRHVLQRHFNIPDDAVHTWQTSFDAQLRLPELISRYYVGSGLATGSKGALAAFDDLVKSIKALSEDDKTLPLSVMNISAASDALRYTSVFSPVPLPSSIASVLPPNAKYVHPIDFIIEFERSSRWPDDLKAIQKVKLAFLERIAKGLMVSISGCQASVVVRRGTIDSEVQDVARLEIITAEGWTFSGRIWQDREATLLDRIINNTSGLPHITVKSKAAGKGKEYHDAVQAREAYTRLFIHSPQHHRAIAKLCHHFSAFAGTVRLAKRWFASHWLLGGHVSEEVIELICAQFFVREGWDAEVDKEQESGNHNVLDRMSVPGSKERGFASLIRFLKDWRWEEGLFVPLYGSTVSVSAQPKAVTAASTGVWKIRTRMDEEGAIWTMRGPDAIVARRVQALAQATWNYLQDMELSGKGSVLCMFDHPTEDYNVIVKLDPSVIPRYHQHVLFDESKLSKWSNKQSTDNSGSQVRPGFDPARELYRDLQSVYRDTFRIFYDYFGGTQFGIVWDPSLKEPSPFRVLSGFSFIPTSNSGAQNKSKKSKDKDMVTLNEMGVLGEIERIGTDVVAGITIQE